MIEIAIDMNKRLEIETARMKNVANKQYGEDLKNQIVHNKDLAVSLHYINFALYFA